MVSTRTAQAIQTATPAQPTPAPPVPRAAPPGQPGRIMSWVLPKHPTVHGRCAPTDAFSTAEKRRQTAAKRSMDGRGAHTRQGMSHGFLCHLVFGCTR